MQIKKKKINVIRPTLRHKKAYLSLIYSKELSDLDPKKCYRLIFNNLQKVHGVFISADTNPTIISIDNKSKEILVRINKVYLNEFISSLFFLEQDLGLIFIKKINTTIKQSKK